MRVRYTAHHQKHRGKWIAEAVMRGRYMLVFDEKGRTSIHLVFITGKKLLSLHLGTQTASKATGNIVGLQAYTENKVNQETKYRHQDKTWDRSLLFANSGLA